MNGNVSMQRVSLCNSDKTIVKSDQIHDKMYKFRSIAAISLLIATPIIRQPYRATCTSKNFFSVLCFMLSSKYYTLITLKN